MQLPVELRQALERELAGVDGRELARASAELTESYRGGGAGKWAIASPAQRVAYAAVRMPATYAANLAVMRELKLRAPETKIHTLLDLGAGPGTALWAAAQSWPDLQRATLVERDIGFIDLGKRLSAETAFQFESQWMGQELRQFTGGPHDAVLLSYVIGELREDALRELLRRAWTATAQALLVIEPGTPEGYRRVLAAREFLIGLGAELAAPCPHEEECPMLSRPGEWCHFAARVERTAMHRKIKGGTLGHEDEKFSYVIFCRQPMARAGARIVRHPLRHKGHVQLELCAREGLKRETVTRKAGASYRAARNAEWGDAWEEEPRSVARESSDDGS